MLPGNFVLRFMFCIFLVIYPFHLAYRNCWYLFTTFCYNPFYFCEVGSTAPTFISDFSNLRLFLFSLAIRFSILLSFSTNSTEFSLLFFLSVPLIFILIFISFLPLLLGFVFFFHCPQVENTVFDLRSFFSI